MSCVVPYEEIRTAEAVRSPGCDAAHRPLRGAPAEGAGLQLGRRHGAAPQVALPERAARRAQELELRLGLDPLGEGLQAEPLGETDHRRDQDAALLPAEV